MKRNSRNASIITLTTDFGEGSPYVAQMKGAALSINPDATVIDITHGISAQNVRQGALTLNDVAHQFPPDTVHVCVVDPGVGTDRKILYARVNDQRFIAPDNGLLSLVATPNRAREIRVIQSRRFWRQHVSATFHGRDIMAPVAAHLTLGVPPDQLGPAHANPMQLDWPGVQRKQTSLTGTVLLIDHFGNLITNITRDLLPGQIATSNICVTCGDHAQVVLVDTYGQAAPGTVVALFGSNDRLEIAVTNGNAAQLLGARVNTPVHLSWDEVKDAR